MQSISVVLAAGLAMAPGCGSDSVVACNLVTRQDATRLFGQEAENRAYDPHEGVHVLIPPIDACIWMNEVEDESGSVSSQSLRLDVLPPDTSPRMTPADSEAFAVGDDGYIRWNEEHGVSISWTQGGYTLSLYYFSAGDDMPTHASRLEPMKALAQDVSKRL